MLLHNIDGSTISTLPKHTMCGPSQIEVTAPQSLPVSSKGELVMEAGRTQDGKVERVTLQPKPLQRCSIFHPVLKECLKRRLWCLAQFTVLRKRITRPPGINYLCSQCGNLLYHVGLRDSMEESVLELPLQPYQIATRLRICPECGHRLEPEASAEAIKIARS